MAYWPGLDDFCKAVGTTRSEIFARYHAVIHLRVPDALHGYDHQNPLRVESADEARAIDERIGAAWTGHPHLHVIDAETDFMEKARRALEILRADLPECCRPNATGKRPGANSARERGTAPALAK